RLTSLTAELVALNSSVIVVGSTSGIVSTRKVTQTVPLITIGTTDDPVRLGLAENFARPGRNVTGFLLVADQEIVGKEAPTASRCRPRHLARWDHHESRLPGRCRRGENFAVRRSSVAVAISREGHRSPRLGREGQHRRWGRGRWKRQ